VTEFRVALDDGAHTTVERWGARGPVVMAVHGMASSRKSWARMAQHLDGQYRVIAYDQRGHGDSSGVGGPMTLERGMRDLENVIAAVGEPIDLLIGHSWGGAIAIEAGLRIPVWRVAAVDPMIRQAEETWYREFIQELREQFASEGPAREALIRASEDYADWGALDVEAKVHAVATMTPAPIEGLLRDNPPGLWDLRKSIEHYDKPLLLAIAAAGEGVLDVATQEAIERSHPSSVEIVSFPPGAGHSLHRTAFPEFARVLDDFLSRT
jgi:pimeloyl-ACP methyl ester carboxylesterase